MKNFAPWYIIVWRLLFIPVFYIGFVIAFVGLLLTFGVRQAKYFWSDNFVRFW